MPKNDRGSVTVEFALVTPFVALVILVLLQTGVAAKDGVLIAHAAREGARQAATTDDNGEIGQAVRAAASGLDHHKVRVSWNTPGGWRAGRAITVTVEYDTPCLFPGIAKIWPGLTHRATATMRREKDR
ncbi:MAG: TadE family protein [Actinomycetota bacterium]